LADQHVVDFSDVSDTELIKCGITMSVNGRQKVLGLERKKRAKIGVSPNKTTRWLKLSKN